MSVRGVMSVRVDNNVSGSGGFAACAQLGAMVSGSEGGE